MTVPLWLLAIPSVVLGILLTFPGPPLGPLFGIAEGEGLAHGGSTHLRARRGAPGPPPERASSSAASTAR